MTQPAAPHVPDLRDLGESKAIVLVLDPMPEVRSAHYLAWQARGTRLTVETDLELLAARLVSGRFTLVLLPLAGDPPPGTFWEDWAQAYAPRMRHAFAYFGDEAECTTSERDPALSRLRRLQLAPFPSSADVRRAAARLDAIGLAAFRASRGDLEGAPGRGGADDGNAAS